MESFKLVSASAWVTLAVGSLCLRRRVTLEEGEKLVHVTVCLGLQRQLFRPRHAQSKQSISLHYVFVILSYKLAIKLSRVVGCPWYPTPYKQRLSQRKYFPNFL